MKMSNENESIDMHFYANRRSNWINWEEYNRMERPSRVFSTRHHLSIPPVNPDPSSMEQAEQFRRLRTTNNYGGYESMASNSSARLNNEIADVPINEDSDEEYRNIDLRRHYIEQRRLIDHINTSVLQQTRNSRSGRQSRRYTEHPYYIRNQSEISSNNNRMHRRGRFSASNRDYNQPNDRSQTPEQELPEVFELENQYEEVYHSQESISPILTHNEDSGDDRRSINFSVSESQGSNLDEENRELQDASNDIPITRRIVPFNMSPVSSEALSPQTDSPPDISDMPTTSTNNDILPALQFDNDNSNTIFRDIKPTITEETTTERVEEHPETYEELNKQLIHLFECPVCFEHIVPPIFQCLFGHLICSRCVRKCENCPTCRNPFNVKRNLFMEKVGYLVKFPCKNSLIGCEQQMFLGQKETHEQECCYRHYHCFIANCVWKGYYPEMHLHMANNHHNYILNGSTQSLDIMLSSNTQTYKWFLLAHSEYFSLISLVSLASRRVKIQVNYIGPANKAKQFKYTIILNQQNERGDTIQKLVYERLTIPYSDIYEMSNHTYKKKGIFSLPTDVLQPYIIKRRLPITLKVDPASN